MNEVKLPACLVTNDRNSRLALSFNQCFHFIRTIGWVTPKIIHFHYPKTHFLDQVFKNILFNFEKGSMGFNRVHHHGLQPEEFCLNAHCVHRKIRYFHVRCSSLRRTLQIMYQQRTLSTSYLSPTISAEPSLQTFVSRKRSKELTLVISRLVARQKNRWPPKSFVMHKVCFNRARCTEDNQYRHTTRVIDVMIYRPRNKHVI